MIRVLSTFVLLTGFVVSSVAEPPVIEDTYVITPLKLRYADAASIEPVPDTKKVAVFAINMDSKEHEGVLIHLNTKATEILGEARQVFGQCVGPAIPLQMKASGELYFTGPPGKYEVGISLFGEDFKKKKLTISDVIVGTPGTPDPIDPPPPPPTDGLEAFYKAAYDASKAMGDPNTCKLLATSYASALEATKGKSMDETKVAINAATTKALQTRDKPSFRLAWDVFVVRVNEQLKPLATDVNNYRAAISVLIKALNAS